MAYKILDISKYQPLVDYAKTAAAVDGVILRIGLTYWGAQNMGMDECFEQHYAGFKAQGLPVGAYFYSAADSVAMAEKEADCCLELMKGKQFELPVYYDVENSQRQGGLSKELLTQIVDAFCSKVEKAGYFVGFYASTSWLQSKLDTAALCKKYTLWKADYRTAYDKTIACDMHQYTSGGKVDGIDGRVDMSDCYRDFVSVIKNSGLNGFAAQGVNPAEPKREAMRLLISAKDKQPMSKGDVKTFAELLDDLQIDCEVTTGGYIITKDMVTGGDIATIEAKAAEIGNIEVQEYVPDAENPEACAECDLLEKQIAELKAQLVVEQQYKEGYWQDVQRLTASLEKKEKELSAANNALAAERGSNELYVKENAQLTDKLNKIREIVGG